MASRDRGDSVQRMAAFDPEALRLSSRSLAVSEEDGFLFSGGKDGFYGITCLAWRIAVGAASQIHRDSNHGKTGNTRTVWRLEHKRAGLAKSQWFPNIITGIPNQLTAVSNHGSFPIGGPETAPANGQAHPHSRPRFREPKRLSSFEQKRTAFTELLV